MKLTKEQAIEKHREVWNWIADKIIEEKNVLIAWATINEKDF